MDLYLLCPVFVTIGFAMSGVIVCDVKEVARLEDKLRDFRLLISLKQSTPGFVVPSAMFIL